MENPSQTRLGTAPIGKLILQLSLPSVAAQLINVLYNIVDRIYIGHIEGIGDLALTGVGITFPIITLVSAFSSFAGAGGAPLAAIRLGAKDKDGAEKILGNSTFLLLCFSFVLTIFFQLFKTPLLMAFGASENIIGYGESYLGIYLWGTLFVQLALGLNTFISAQGNAKVAMLSVVIGAVINILLDPVFIFVFNMGVEGAALATILSQLVSAVWVLAFLCSKRSAIQLQLQAMRPKIKIIGRIAALGISPFVMMATESLVSITLNSSLQRYGGDLHVGVMTILTSIMQLVVVPISGFAQGCQPIISYNFGARQFDRVKTTFRRVILITFCISTCCCLVTVAFPQVFVGMFTDKQELFQLTCQKMPIYLGGMWAFGAQLGCQNTFMGLGQAKISLFLAALRKIILLIPLALALPLFFQVDGVYLAEPIADITAAAVTLVVFLLNYRKILEKGPQTL